MVIFSENQTVSNARYVLVDRVKDGQIELTRYFSTKLGKLIEVHAVRVTRK